MQILSNDGTSLHSKYSYDDSDSPFLSKTRSHTEALVVQWAKKIVKQYQKQLKEGGTIKLLIFTRKPPCPVCKAAAQKAWLDAMRQAGGNSDLKIEISIWYDSDENQVAEGIVKESR